MKTIFFLFAILVFSTVSFAGAGDTIQPPALKKWSDISVFQIAPSTGNNHPLMLFNHEEGTYFVEARMGFDWANTAAVLVGKTFSKSDRFWVRPKAGVMFSFDKTGWDGFSLETNLGGQFKRFGYFAMNQAAFAVDDKHNFIYQYVQLGLRIRKNIDINVAYQVLGPFGIPKSELDALVVTDIGPQMRIKFGMFYLKPWVTIDPWRPDIKKLIIGAGYSF